MFHGRKHEAKKKDCNDDRKIYMMQSLQISRKVHSFMRKADHGIVPEGVADKPFFFTSSSRTMRFNCNSKVNRVS